MVCVSPVSLNLVLAMHGENVFARIEIKEFPAMNNLLR